MRSRRHQISHIGGLHRIERKHRRALDTAATISIVAPIAIVAFALILVVAN